MAITFPYDLLAGFPGWQTDFKIYRRQELSRTASGKTIVKDIGDPLWMATYTSKAMKPNDLDRWRARLEVLDGGLQTFRGYVLSRCYPIMHPRGDWGTGVTWNGICAIQAIATNRKELSLKNVPVGFRLRQGDVMMIGQGRIHRVQNTINTTTTSTALIEVRPHLRPDIAIDDVVTFVKPWCTMNIDVDGLDAEADLSGLGAISFTATEAI